jgi:hypothetical protein
MSAELRVRSAAATAGAWALLTMSACSGALDAGSDLPHGLLPVDERNPIVISNDDAFDNWQGEYAVLLAASGGPTIAGIVVNDSTLWPDLVTNAAGWRDLVAAARDSGLRNIPDPVSSHGAPLSDPGNGDLDATVPNNSPGAQLIIELSRRLSRSYRPLVVVTGGRLTDVADAYLLDHSVRDRIVVVSSLGTISASGAAMGAPNGDLDPWADAIVTARLRYVQVSAYYDQAADIPESFLSALPANPLAAWITAKRPNLIKVPSAADQVSVIAVGLPAFVAEVKKVSPDPNAPASTGGGPHLVSDPAGQHWLVTRSEASLASAQFQRLLTDPRTFGP